MGTSPAAGIDERARAGAAATLVACDELLALCRAQRLPVGGGAAPLADDEDARVRRAAGEHAERGDELGPEGGVVTRVAGQTMSASMIWTRNRPGVGFSPTACCAWMSRASTVALC